MARGLSLPIAIAVAAGVLAAPQLCLASSFALAWPEGAKPGARAACVDPKQLAEAIQQRLGRDPFVAVAQADVVLEGRDLPPRAGRPRARVEQHAPGGRLLGSRDLEAASCAELTRAAAFVIVLIVDPDALDRESDAATEPVPPAPPPPAARPPTSPARRPRRSPPRPAPREEAASLVAAGAGVTFASGLLPGGGAGAAILLGVTPWRAPVRFEWHGSYEVSLTSPRGRSFAALEQQWRACYLLQSRSIFGASACAGAAWAAIVPGASGLTQGDQSAKVVLGPLVAVGPQLRLGAWAAFADVSVFSPQPRYLFSYLDDAGRRRELHEVDRFVVGATIGVTRAF